MYGKLFQSGINKTRYDRTNSVISGHQSLVLFWLLNDSASLDFSVLTHPFVHFSISVSEQKTRYETYISLLQAKIRTETDDLEKIEASAMGGLIMEGGLGGRGCHLRKTQSSPSINQAHGGLNGKATGCTAPGQRSWEEHGEPETAAHKMPFLPAKLV